MSTKLGFVVLIVLASTGCKKKEAPAASKTDVPSVAAPAKAPTPAEPPGGSAAVEAAKPAVSPLTAKYTAVVDAANVKLQVINGGDKPITEALIKETIPGKDADAYNISIEKHAGKPLAPGEMAEFPIARANLPKDVSTVKLDVKNVTFGDGTGASFD